MEQGENRLVGEQENRKQGGWVSGLAILTIAFLETFALYRGHDGWLMTLAVTAIAGIGGYNLQPERLRRFWRR